MSAPKSPEAASSKPKPRFNAYTVLLILSFCFVSIGCLVLYLELNRYAGDIATPFNEFKIEGLAKLKASLPALIPPADVNFVPEPASGAPAPVPLPAPGIDPGAGGAPAPEGAPAGVPAPAPEGAPAPAPEGAPPAVPAANPEPAPEGAPPAAAAPAAAPNP